jgi:hypothetical protein
MSARRRSSAAIQMLAYVPSALPSSVTLSRGPGRRPTSPYVLRRVVVTPSEAGEAGRTPEFVEKTVEITARWNRFWLIGVGLFVSALAAGEGMTDETHRGEFAAVGTVLSLVGIAFIAITRFEPVGPDRTALARAITRICASRPVDGQVPDDAIRREAEVSDVLWALARDIPWLARLPDESDLVALLGSLAALAMVVGVTASLGSDTADRWIATAAIGLLASLAGAYAGAVRGAAGMRAAIEAQRRHATMAHVCAQYATTSGDMAALLARANAVIGVRPQPNRRR